MHDRTLKHLMIWLLIASPLWWTGGCSSTRIAQNLGEEDPTNAIEIITKHNLVYDLSVWRLDANGNIVGEGEQVIRQAGSEGNPLLIPFNGVIARDSVRTVLITEAYGAATVGTIILLAGGAVALVLFLNEFIRLSGRFM